MKIKLVKAVPFSGRYVPPQWAVNFSCLNMPDNSNHALLVRLGMDTDKARQDMAEWAVEHHVEYIWFIDDDTVPPINAAIDLMWVLDNHLDISACGGVYCAKKKPTYPLVFNEIGGGSKWNWKVGETFPVNYIATGCLMIRVAALELMPKPWFKFIWNKAQAKREMPDFDLVDLGYANDVQLGEDMYFCYKAQKSGLTIIAHGGVLPVHYDQEGNSYELDPESYPMRKEELIERT